MRKLILVILVSNLILSCSSQEKDFINTKWIYDFGDCQDVLEFKEKRQYTFYSCETNETVYGEYAIDNEIVILEQKKGEFDEEFTSNSRHKTPHLKFKLRLKNKQLIYEERLELDSDLKWIKSNFKFDNSYSYKKVK